MKSSAVKDITRKIRLPLNRRQAMNRLAEFHSQERSIEETVHWAINFGGHGYFKIQTQQIVSEITALANAVNEIKPKTILEIGTARGGTLLIWSSIATELVVTCDVEDKSIQESFLKSLPPPRSDCEVVLMLGDSHSEPFKAKVTNVLYGKPVDFLFIDGDHRLEGAASDFEMYSPLVRPGGLIAFHDIVERQKLETNQVFPLWQRLKTQFPHEEFVSDPDQCGYGIGLIRVPLKP